jgi:hypothetical protein
LFPNPDLFGLDLTSSNISASLHTVLSRVPIGVRAIVAKNIYKVGARHSRHVIFMDRFSRLAARNGGAAAAEKRLVCRVYSTPVLTRKINK